MTHSGKVYLVGSGLGSVDDLTLRAYALLRQADVLVYDALAEGELLRLVGDRCLKLDVGKRGGQPSASQAEINRLLVDHCQQGRQVVRLKSGDPFIFGRALSEIEALNQAGCPFEVVPGISSALAAPLLADIPLTDPVMSRCFAVLTAHDLEAIDWQAIAQLETLVILMGARQLPAIVERLQLRGKPAETPVAVIRWAGQPQQQIWTGTLASIERQTAHCSLSPAVIVIGAVVGLRPYVRSAVSSENDLQTRDGLEAMRRVGSPDDVSAAADAALPLTGKTILVTRSAGQSSRFTVLLQQQGATAIETPALEIVPPSSWAALDQAIDQLDGFDWLILTSTNGVDYFFDRLVQLGKDARALASLKIAVVGQKTAASLKSHGISPDFIPPNFVADALVEHFPDRDRLSGMKLLFPRVETGGREVLVRELSAQGAVVTEAAAYQSICAPALAPAALAALQARQVDILTFASSKTVQCFHQLYLLSPAAQSSLAIASIGPQTSADCLRCFGRVDIEASEYTLEGLTQAIVDWVGSGSQRQ